MHPAIVQTPVEACRPRLRVDYRWLVAKSKTHVVTTRGLGASSLTLVRILIANANVSAAAKL